MSQIPLDSAGKRPRFFPSSGTDESVSMILELMSEVWIVRERLYALEQVIEDAGIDVSDRLEKWRPTAEQDLKLDKQREQFIKSVLRSLEANHVPGRHLRRSLDTAAQADDAGEQLTEAVQVA
ncbi:MAG: hypothetical protein OEU86_03110 [Gammaproteobacteria bacterium]|nr:hypothetical protein [Gammaproteobacteria bacterium]